MNKKITLTLILLNLMVFFAKAQEFEVPKNYQFSTAADYAKYEKDIIACAKWLENTPLNEQTLKRKEANAFLVKWLTGTSTVTISIGKEIVDFTDKNNELLVLFMAGWARYTLENNYNKDIHKGYYAGLVSMIKVYNKGIAIVKDKEMADLIKIYNQGGLEKWISENIKNN